MIRIPLRFLGEAGACSGRRIVPGTRRAFCAGSLGNPPPGAPRRASLRPAGQRRRLCGAQRPEQLASKQKRTNSLSASFPPLIWKVTRAFCMLWTHVEVELWGARQPAVPVRQALCPQGERPLSSLPDRGKGLLAGPGRGGIVPCPPARQSLSAGACTVSWEDGWGLRVRQLPVRRRTWDLHPPPTWGRLPHCTLQNRCHF